MPAHEYASYSMGDDFLIPQCTCGWQGATVLRSTVAIEAYGDHRAACASGVLVDHLQALPDLVEVASWLDTYDSMASLFIDDFASESEPGSERALAAMKALSAVSSTEVQDDLRRYMETTNSLLGGTNGNL